MITSVFLNVIYNGVAFLLGLIPDVASNSTIGNALATANTYISTAHSFLPLTVTAILAIIGIDIVFESGYLLFKIVYWIIRRFPTQS